MNKNEITLLWWYIYLVFLFPTLTLFRVGLFEAAHGYGGFKKATLAKFVTHPATMKLTRVVLYVEETQDMCKSFDTTLDFCWNQHFFTRRQHLLLYQEMQVCIVFWYIISNFFNFVLICKGCFNRHGSNFYDLSKIGFSRSL